MEKRRRPLPRSTGTLKPEPWEEEEARAAPTLCADFLPKTKKNVKSAAHGFKKKGTRGRPTGGMTSSAVWSKPKDLKNSSHIMGNISMP